MNAIDVMISVVHPPYTESDVQPRPATLNDSLVGFGSVALVIPGPGATPEHIRRAVLTQQRSCPWAPVALFVPDVNSDTALVNIRLAYQAGARAVVLEHKNVRRALTLQLCETVSLPRDLCGWLERNGLTVPDRLRLMLSGIDGESDSTIPGGGQENPRVPFRGAQKWLVMLRAARAMLDAQRNRNANLTTIAHVHNYSDQAAMCRAVRNAFGMSPTQARNILGWEPLAYAWFRALLQVNRSDLADMAPLGRKTAKRRPL